MNSLFHTCKERRKNTQRPHTRGKGEWGRARTRSSSVSDFHALLTRTALPRSFGEQSEKMCTMVSAKETKRNVNRRKKHINERKIIISLVRRCLPCGSACLVISKRHFTSLEATGAGLGLAESSDLGLSGPGPSGLGLAGSAAFGVGSDPPPGNELVRKFAIEPGALNGKKTHNRFLRT